MKITNENNIFIMKNKKMKKNILKYIIIIVFGIIIFALSTYYVIKKFYDTNGKYFYIKSPKEQKNNDISNIEI